MRPALPDTKTGYKHLPPTKKKSHTNTLFKHKCENPQQNTSKSTPAMYKKDYMTKWNLCREYNIGLTYDKSL